MYRIWNAEQFRDYIKAHHGGYEPVFWSGNSIDDFNNEIIKACNESIDFCKRHNAMFEEGEQEYKTVAIALHDAGYDVGSEHIDWNEASRVFAEESSGKAHVFIGEYCDYENNCWNTVERETIINNVKIHNDIDFINVVTLEHNTLNKNELPKIQTEKQAQLNIKKSCDNTHDFSNSEYNGATGQAHKFPIERPKITSLNKNRAGKRFEYGEGFNSLGQRTLRLVSEQENIKEAMRVR